MEVGGKSRFRHRGVLRALPLQDSAVRQGNIQTRVRHENRDEEGCTQDGAKEMHMYREDSVQSIQRKHSKKNNRILKMGCFNLLRP